MGASAASGHFPESDKDVMKLLGWRDHGSLKTAYQHADPEGMLTALRNRRELREVAQ